MNPLDYEFMLNAFLIFVGTTSFMWPIIIGAAIAHTGDKITRRKAEKIRRQCQERGTLKCCIQDIEKEKIEAGDQYR